MRKKEKTEMVTSVRSGTAVSLPGPQQCEDGAGRREVSPSEAGAGQSDQRWGSTMHWWLGFRRPQLTEKRWIPRRSGDLVSPTETRATLGPGAGGAAGGAAVLADLVAIVMSGFFAQPPA